MKTKTTKNRVAAKPKKRPISSQRKKVVLAHAKIPLVRHLRLIEHRHSFKLIHFRHTSHVALILILAFVGFFLYANQAMVQAETSDGSILVGAVVPGPAPTTGASITSPVDGANFTDKTVIEVAGKCAGNSFVIVRDDDQTVGSTICTDAGVFNLQIQLHLGKNVLSSLNYDNLNQAGPTTPSVTVNVSNSTNVSAAVEVATPALPINPSIVTGVSTDLSSCQNYKAETMPTGGEPHIAVVCVPRLLLPQIEQVMGIMVWGGSPPYAVSIDFGENASSTNKDTLLSISSPGYKTISLNYAVPSTYKIAFKLKDGNGKLAIVQTSVQVNGEVATTVATITNDIFNTPWFKTPVPFYLLAVAITLGFWGGDIFDRKFGSGKSKRRTKRVA